MRDLGDQVGVTLRDPIFSIEGEVRHWGLRFLTKSASTEPSVFFSTPEQPIEIDNLDQRILKMLQSGGDSSAHYLGGVLGIAATTVRYRIDRLRRLGVLSDDLYFAKSNSEFLQAQLVLNLKARSAENELRVTGVCTKNTHVEGIISGVGSWDFKIILQAESMRELIDVQDMILQELGKIVDRSVTLVRDKVLLVSTGLPWSTDGDSRMLAALYGASNRHSE